jgi:hypothetical protein
VNDLVRYMLPRQFKALVQTVSARLESLQQSLQEQADAARSFSEVDSHTFEGDTRAALGVARDAKKRKKR